VVFEVLLGAFDHRELLTPGEFAGVVSDQYVWLAAIAGAALIGLGLIRQSPSRIGWPDIPLLALAVAFVVWWVLNRGMIHIGGYDHSLLANYGWLQLQGMRPHVDFPCTLNPHFYLGVKYAFTWFGVAWRSTVILAAVYAGVSFTWSYFLLRSMDLPKTTAGLIALLGQSLCLMMGCYFWYNSVGANDGIILVLAALAWAERPCSKLLFASVTVALALVLLDKPNGWVLPACVAIGFLGSREHRVRFLGCILGAAGIVLAVAYFGPFDIAATIRVYAHLARNRPPGLAAVFHSLNFKRWHAPVELGKLCIFTATFLVVSVASLWTHRSTWRTTDGRWWAGLWAYLGALAMGLALFATNFEPKCTDLAVPSVAFAVLVAKRAPWRSGSAVPDARQILVKCGAWLCLFILVQGLFNGWIRYRVYYINPGQFWQKTVSDEPVATSFMAGVRGSPRLVGVMDDLVEAVSSHPSDRVFFGPWIEFAYPAFGKKPPERFPVWWHPDISYFPEDASFALEAFRNGEFDTLITLRDNLLLGMPEEITSRLGEWYVVDKFVGALTVYRRKD
jgi:hypothetical protein